MTTQWHLDPGLAEHYASGRLPTVTTSSVEQHLTACADCQGLVTPYVDVPRLDRVWAEVAERVETPRPTLLERLLRRLHIREDTARLVAATPSLRGAWLTGVVVVLALAVSVGHLGANGVAFFLAFAPVLPMLGVAAAFGPGSDPTHEISAATPYSAVRLLAIRGAVVVPTTVALAAVAALLLPGSPWLAVGWLLPAFALTIGTLALATRVEPLHAAVALSLGWVGVVLPGLLHNRDPLFATQASVQLASVIALAAAAAVIVIRRDQLPELLRRIS